MPVATAGNDIDPTDTSTATDGKALADTATVAPPLVQVQITAEGIATCNFVNRDEFGDMTAFQIHWQRSTGSPFLKESIQVEPCESVACWVSFNHQGQELKSEFSLESAKIDWCHPVWDSVDFSVETTPDMPTIEGNIRLIMRTGIPVPKGQLNNVGACRLVCNEAVHPASCNPLVYWNPEKQVGIKWFSLLTALPTDTNSTCTVEVLETAPESKLPPLATLDANQHIQLELPLFTATIPPAGTTHFLTNIGADGAAASRLTLVDSLGQHYKGVVETIDEEENNTVAAVYRLAGRYQAEDAPANTFNKFEMRLTAVRSALYLGLEHSIVLTSPDLQQRTINSMTLEFETLNKLEHVDLAGEHVQLSTDDHAKSLFDGPDHVSITVDTLNFQKAHAPGSIAITNEFGTMGIALRHPHQEYPKLMHYMPAEDANAARISIDLWPVADDEQWLFDSHPKSLKNELQELKNWFCVGPVEGSLSIGSIKTQPCVDWLTATTAQKQTFIDSLAADPDAPVLLSDFGSSLTALDALLEECGPLCDKRWMIYDSRGSYKSDARGISKTHYMGITFVRKTRRLTPY